MRLGSFLLAAAASVAISSMAAAADLGVRPAPKAPLPPVLTWTGPYIGLNAGLARHDWSFTDTNCWYFACDTFWTSNKTGFIGGGQVGFNWQSGTLVIGVEADINWLGIKKSETFGPVVAFPVFVANATAEINWLATFRARLGATSGATLAYVTGGLAAADVKNRWGVGFTGAFPGFPPADWDSDFVEERVRLGWTAGFGIEHMITQHWSFRAETLYVDLGTYTANVTGPFAAGTFTSEFSSALIVSRVGVNLKW